MTNLSKALRTWLDGTFRPMPAALILNKQSADVTDKLLLELEDRSLIETVIIRVPQDGVGLDHSRKTICISTQVGCAMACAFCASGLAGLKRNLSAGEIVAPLLQVCYEEDERTPRARAELASFGQYRRHGHGRASRQLRRAHRGADDPQRALGPRHRRAPDHRLDQRPGAADAPAGRRAAGIPPGAFPPRGDGRGPFPDHAGQPGLSARKTPARGKGFRRKAREDDHARIHPHRGRERFDRAGPEAARSRATFMPTSI